MPAKTKPNPEFMTLQVPKELPPGVELFYDRKYKEWNYKATSQRGIKPMMELLETLPE